MRSNRTPRFAGADELKLFDARLLADFLRPHGAFLTGRGVALPADPTPESMPYEALVAAFMSPGPDTPPGLLESIYHVNALSTPQGREKITLCAKDDGVTLHATDRDTNHDFAMRTWLQSEALSERALVRAQQWKKRSFSYYRCANPAAAAEMPQPDEKATDRLRTDLLQMFDLATKPRCLAVLPFPTELETWYLIRHAAIPIRVVSLHGDGSSETLFFDPEAYDIAIVNWRDGLLKLNAPERLHDGYRAVFSRFVSGDMTFYKTGEIFTLESLRQTGPAPLSPPRASPIETVRLRRMKYRRLDGAAASIEDFPFAERAHRGHSFAPDDAASIVWVDLDIYFRAHKKPRRIRVNTGNKISYSREDDAFQIEQFLRLNGFMNGGQTFRVAA